MKRKLVSTQFNKIINSINYVICMNIFYIEYDYLNRVCIKIMIIGDNELDYDVSTYLRLRYIVNSI